MRTLFCFLLLAAAVFAGPTPTDTVYIPVGMERSAVGVWTPSKKSDHVVVWFHGGMSSRNCEKGLVAGGDISLIEKKAWVISASACGNRHWVTPQMVKAVDDAIDSLITNKRISVKKVSLVGISDGALGVFAYSLYGKRPVKNRLLMSSYGALLGQSTALGQELSSKGGRWRFLQGGADRLYPASETVPWINSFCQTLKGDCKLDFDEKGEHDWSFWQKNHLKEVEESLR